MTLNERVALTDLLKARGVPHMLVDKRKLDALRRKLSRQQGRVVTYTQIFGSYALASCTRRRVHGVCLRLSVMNLKRIHHFFQQHGLLHDYRDILVSVAEVQSDPSAQSAARAGASGLSRD